MNNQSKEAQRNMHLRTYEKATGKKFRSLAHEESFIRRMYPHLAGPDRNLDIVLVDQSNSPARSLKTK